MSTQVDSLLRRLEAHYQQLTQSFWKTLEAEIRAEYTGTHQAAHIPKLTGRKPSSTKAISAQTQRTISQRHVCSHCHRIFTWKPMLRSGEVGVETACSAQCMKKLDQKSRERRFLEKQQKNT